MTLEFLTDEKDYTSNLEKAEVGPLFFQPPLLVFNVVLTLVFST